MDSPWSKLIAFRFVTLSSRRKTLKKLQISASFHIITSSCVHIAKSRKTEQCFFILDKILKKMRYNSFESHNYFLRCGQSKIDQKCSKKTLKMLFFCILTRNFFVSTPTNPKYKG